tara:strand:- start:283 stop:1686 length:1404 start_codon:yes stop_codon:yes gene_type:complete
MKDSVIVLGNGKSLEGFDFLSIDRDIYDIIGCCLAFRYWDQVDWYPDIYVNVDKVVCSKNEEVKDFVMKKKCKLYLLSNEIKTIWHDYPKDGTIVFIEDLLQDNATVFKFCVNYCSGSASVLMAIDHYENIHCAGFDCDYVEFIPESKKLGNGSLLITKTPSTNPNYFINDYQRAGDQYNVPNGSTEHHTSWKQLSHIFDFIKKMFPNHKRNLTNYNNKKSISQYIKTIEFEKLIPLCQNMTQQEKSKICFCVPSTSNQRDWVSFNDTYLNQILCKSLECKVNDYDIDIYIGYDADDKLYSTIELPKTNKGMNLIWKSFDNEKGNPCKIWTELSKQAVKDNHDYFMVCGDDIAFDQNDNWIKVFIDQLKRNKNIGYSAGWSNNDNIPTQFMFHKRHLDIFEFVYPPQIHNYFCDDFIYGLYGQKYGNWMKEYKHLNAGGPPRYTPKDDKKLCKILIKRYKKNLSKVM